MVFLMGVNGQRMKKCAITVTRQGAMYPSNRTDFYVLNMPNVFGLSEGLAFLCMEVKLTDPLPTITRLTVGRI